MINIRWHALYDRYFNKSVWNRQLRINCDAALTLEEDKLVFRLEGGLLLKYNACGGMGDKYRT